MNSVKSFVLLLLALIAVVLTQQGTATSCMPSPGLNFAQCRQKIVEEHCPMKFTGPGCKRKNGRRWLDGGCQCEEYCGYHCKKACNRDKRCRWNKSQNKCFLRDPFVAGTAIPECVRE